jgi:undecaprenyl-diphosphatase
MRNKNSKILKYSIISLLLSSIILVFLSSRYLSSIDLWINANIQGLWTSSLNSAMIFMTSILIPLFLLASALIALYLMYKKQNQKAVFFLTSILIGAVFIQLLKLLFDKVRPGVSLIIETNSSFPSSHAAVSLIFFLVIIYLFKDSIKDRIKRYTFIAVSMLIPFLIGFSRIYLNVHWLSDVLAGFTAAFMYFSILALTASKIRFKDRKKFR